MVYYCISELSSRRQFRRGPLGPDLGESSQITEEKNGYSEFKNLYQGSVTEQLYEGGAGAGLFPVRRHRADAAARDRARRP